MRASSRDTVDGARPSRAASCRHESPAATPRLISSRSAMLSDRGARLGGWCCMPPVCSTNARTDGTPCRAGGRSAAATHLAATGPRPRPAPLLTVPRLVPTTSSADAPVNAEVMQHPLRPPPIRDSSSAISGASRGGGSQGGLLCVSNPVRLGACCFGMWSDSVTRWYRRWGRCGREAFLSCAADHGSDADNQCIRRQLHSRGPRQARACSAVGEEELGWSGAQFAVGTRGQWGIP